MQKILRFVKIIELVFLNKIWCKWSKLGVKIFFLSFILIIFIDKNSKTKIAILHAINIGCNNFSLAIKISKKEIIKPNNKLPLSPKNNFGSLNILKLKHKNIKIGIKIININNLISSSPIMKYKINNVDNIEIINVPSSPSK